MQVTSFHPVQVGASVQTPQVVKNLGATVYYRSQEGVSSATNDGNVTEGNSVTIYGRTFFVTAAGTTSDITSTPVAQAPATTTMPGRREIESVAGVIKESSTVGVWATVQTEKLMVQATALKFETTEQPLNVFYYDPKLYEIAGRTTTLTLEQLIMTNATAPTASFIAGLYKVATVVGPEKKHEVTVEAVVAGSTTQITTPAKETLTQSAVTFPSSALAAGFYLLGVETITATTAAKSDEAITLTVFATS